MDITTLTAVLETAPGRLKQIIGEIEARTEEKRGITFFLDAV
jgi:hypothetical protein